MSFYACLVFGVISLSLGGVAGCFACIILGKLLNRAYLKSRFTVVCILLSVAVAFAAGGFILISNILFQIRLLPSHALFFLSLFFIGLLASSFWRTALPLFVLLYIILSTFTGINLYSVFGSKPENVSVTVTFQSVGVGDQVYFVDSLKDKSLVVEVFTLPSFLLIPLPRVWYSVIGVADSDSTLELDKNFRGKSFFVGLTTPLIPESSLDSDSFIRKLSSSYLNKLLSNRKNLLIPIPADSTVPAVYSLRFQVKGETLSCNLIKAL